LSPDPIGILRPGKIKSDKDQEMEMLTVSAQQASLESPFKAPDRGNRRLTV